MADFKPDIRSAVEASGLADGCRISFHHHLRHGDKTLPLVLNVLCEMGFRDLTLCVSSMMGAAGAAVLDAVRAGVVSSIETTGMKEPLASAVMNGELPEFVIFRSHGGRAEAIVSGRTPVDVAFIAVSAVDNEGNANGTDGPNRFGSLGYALVDAEHAAYKVLITDYVSDSPLEYISIPAGRADCIVIVDSIGDRSVLSGGTLRTSVKPVEQAIALAAAEAIDAAGAVKPGMRFQAGSGAVSLAVSRMIADMMRESGTAGEFALGGVTGTLSALLEEGVVGALYDVQSFDDAAALSLKRNPHHVEISAWEYAAPGNTDCYAHKLDLMVLSAAEADCDFNINSLTGSDGRILGALGGAPDTAEGAKLTAVVLPSVRGRIPTIRERVHTICTPGASIDMIVTERGICVNPARPELRTDLEKAGIAVTDISLLMERVRRITGKPEYPRCSKNIVGTVERRDGTVLDNIHPLY